LRFADVSKCVYYIINTPSTYAKRRRYLGRERDDVMQQNAYRSDLGRRRLLGVIPAAVGATVFSGIARAVAPADPVQLLVDDFVNNGKWGGVSVALPT